MNEHDKLVKVEFRVESEDGGVDVETLWATDLGGGRYKLDNSPFYAYSVSTDDTIRADVPEDGGFPVFVKVLEKSGNRTVRVIFDPPVQDGNESHTILEGLVQLGCSYEGANRSYMAITIPKNVDLDEIRRYLIDSGIQWEHADPADEELYPDGGHHAP